MDEPRPRRPLSLVFVQVVVILGLIAGWLTVAGTLSKTVLDGVHTLEIHLSDEIPEQLARGHHTLGGTEAEPAGAMLIRDGILLRLFDVAPLPFFGMRLLAILKLAAALVALHLVDRIVRATSASQPFAERNARRCLKIGWWMLASWILGVVEVWVAPSLVAAADVDGLAEAATWGLPGTDLTALLLAACGFCAAAVLRYGAELERERALTV